MMRSLCTALISILTALPAGAQVRTEVGDVDGDKLPDSLTITVFEPGGSGVYSGAEARLKTGSGHVHAGSWLAGSGELMALCPFTDGLQADSCLPHREAMLEAVMHGAQESGRGRGAFDWLRAVYQGGREGDGGPFFYTAHFPLEWESDGPLPTEPQAWAHDSLPLPGGDTLPPGWFLFMPAKMSFSGSPEAAPMQMADTDRQYRLWTLPHAVWITGPEGRLWVFVNDSRVTVGPDKLRHAGVMKAWLWQGHVLVQQQNAGFGKTFWLLDPATGRAGAFNPDRIPQIAAQESWELIRDRAGQFFVRTAAGNQAVDLSPLRDALRQIP